MRNHPAGPKDSKYEGNVNFLAEKGTVTKFIFENDISIYNIHQDRKKELVHTFQELKQMLWTKANEKWAHWIKKNV